jgi:hypothetical protein
MQWMFTLLNEMLLGFILHEWEMQSFYVYMYMAVISQLMLAMSKANMNIQTYVVDLSQI